MKAKKKARKVLVVLETLQFHHDLTLSGFLLSSFLLCRCQKKADIKGLILTCHPLL